LAEALAYAPDPASTVLHAARPGATWRPRLGLPEPSQRLTDALDATDRILRAVTPPAGPATFDALLAAAARDRPNETALERLVRRVLLSMLEERRTRQLDISSYQRPARPLFG
jgi:hypothetical protein